jgi:hypothetical protein
MLNYTIAESDYLKLMRNEVVTVLALFKWTMDLNWNMGRGIVSTC